MFRYHGWGPGRSCRNLLASWFTILLTAQLTNSQKFERRLGRRTHVSKSLRDLVNCPDSPAPLGMSRNSRTQQRLRRSLRPDLRVARCASLRPRLLPTGNVSGVLRQVSRLDEQPLQSYCATGAGREAADTCKRSGRTRLPLMSCLESPLPSPAGQRGNRFRMSIPVTKGQLEFEREHLGRKLQVRDQAMAHTLRVARLRPHPMLRVVPGDIETWESV
jgi:hypothetical protein